MPTIRVSRPSSRTSLRVSVVEQNVSLACQSVISAALAEAKDITLYLNPLKRPLQHLEEIDFAECKPLLIPFMNTVGILWGNSRYYCQSAKITVLLQEICNLIIHQVGGNHWADINGSDI